MEIEWDNNKIWESGGHSWAWTNDIRHVMTALYQLSYATVTFLD